MDPPVCLTNCISTFCPYFISHLMETWLWENNAENGKGDRVNIRIPLKLIRTGLKWVSFIPEDTRTKVNEALRDKGIEMDFSKMTPDDLEELVENLDDLTVDVEGQEKVRIFCE